MTRLIYVLVAALLTGVIIHIGTIFTIPYFTTNDSWHRALALGPLQQVHVIADPRQALALSSDLDPTFVYGLCRTDVSEAPVSLMGHIPSDFWSLDYIDRHGRSQFSLTNQISGPAVKIVLATKGQQRLIAERPDLVDETSIVISATEGRGLLLLRAFVSSERERNRIASALSALTCKPLWDPTNLE